MSEDAAGGAEIAVTGEMLDQGWALYIRRPSNAFGSDDLRAIYRAMRALEPARKGLQIYDVDIDDMRDVTAADVAKWQAVMKAYGTLRRRVAEVDAELMRDMAG